MSQKDNILEELKELNSSLAQQNPENCYRVPAGYFDGLAAQVLGRIKAMNTNDPVEELGALSTLLGSLDKKMPYTVPQGYFDQVVSAPIKTQPARIVSIGSRNWFKYAAAAVITGIIVLAGYIYMSGRTESGKKALAKVERIVKKMDDAEKDKLMDFIDAGLSGHETAQVSPDNKLTIKELLQDVSEEELMDLQEQTEDIGDILMTN